MVESFSGRICGNSDWKSQQLCSCLGKAWASVLSRISAPASLSCSGVKSDTRQVYEDQAEVRAGDSPCYCGHWCLVIIPAVLHCSQWPSVCLWTCLCRVPAFSRHYWRKALVEGALFSGCPIVCCLYCIVLYWPLPVTFGNNSQWYPRRNQVDLGGVRSKSPILEAFLSITSSLVLSSLNQPTARAGVRLFCLSLSWLV